MTFLHQTLLMLIVEYYESKQDFALLTYMQNARCLWFNELQSRYMSIVPDIHNVFQFLKATVQKVKIFSVTHVFT